MTGVEIIQAIKEGRIDPKNLGPHDRRLAIQCLRLERIEEDGRIKHWSHDKLAQLFGVSYSMIRQDLRVINKVLLKEMVSRTTRVVASFVGEVERLKSLAMEKDNYDLAWRITKESMEMFGKLGLVPMKGEPLQINVHGNLVHDIEVKAEVRDDNTEQELLARLDPEIRAQYERIKLIAYCGGGSDSARKNHDQN